MPAGHPSSHLSIWIDRDLHQVAAFLQRPANFPRWASGLASGLRPDPVAPVDDRSWIAAGPEGDVHVRFSPVNDLGIADHWVTLSSGVVIYVPLRALMNGSGTEVVLTLFRSPGITDDIFRRDADWVQRDLAALKNLLESSHRA